MYGTSYQRALSQHRQAAQELRLLLLCLPLCFKAMGVIQKVARVQSKHSSRLLSQKAARKASSSFIWLDHAVCRMHVSRVVGIDLRAYVLI